MTNNQRNRAPGYKESNDIRTRREDHYASLRAENDNNLLEIHTLQSELTKIQQRYKDAELTVTKLEKEIEIRHSSVRFEDDTLSPEEYGQFTQVLYDSFAIANRYEEYIQQLQQQLEAEKNQTPEDESADGKARAVAAAYRRLKEKLEQEKSARREPKAQLNAIISQERSQKESLKKTVENLKTEKEKLVPHADSDKIKKLEQAVKDLQKAYQEEQKKLKKAERLVGKGNTDQLKEMLQKLIHFRVLNMNMRKLLAERNNTIAQLQAQMNAHPRSHVASNPFSPTRRVTRSQDVEEPTPPIVEDSTDLETRGDAGDNEEGGELRRAIAQREYEIQVLEASLARVVATNLAGIVIPAPPKPKGKPRKRKRGLGREETMLKEGARFVEKWPHRARGLR